MVNNYLHEKEATDFDAIRLSIASPEDVLNWSHGQVLKPETINYRTQKPEKDGLFCERIFGPTKDFECYCGKYKGAHYRGVTCDRCGVLVSRSIVRRERMGHISLAVPVTHVWFLRGTPSSIGLVLNMTAKSLEKVAYFANYVVTSVDSDKKEEVVKELEASYENNKAAVKLKYEAQAEAEGEAADVKALAEAQTKELAELEDRYTTSRAKVEALIVKALLTESEYRDLKSTYGKLFEAMIGAEGIEHLLNQIDVDATVEELSKAADEAQGQRRRKLLKRLKKLEGMQKSGIKPAWMIMKHLPVIPPDLRPMVQLTGGRFATSDLNDLYRRVINRNNRLTKLMDMNAPEVIRRNEMRMLQEAVDALIDNSRSRGGRAVSTTGGRRKLKSLSDMLRGKQGRFRQNLLGKRVDYSGRSVIVAGPDLNIDQCGLPKMMALELFKPFVIGRLIESEIAHNVKAAGRMIEMGEPEVWDALDQVIEGKYVLLNRAPTLHRLGVQAFRPMLIEGKAIQLHPLVCLGFNADFDGDQMAVHLPLSDEAQAEARTIMAANHNLLKPSDGEVNVYIAQDMVLGAYYMTYERYSGEPKHHYASSEEAQFAFEDGVIELQTPITVIIKGERLTTTVGRALFNEVLPEDFPYQDVTFDNKALKSLVSTVFETYGHETTARVADEIKRIGFQYSTVSGLSTGMDDYIIPEEKDNLMSKGEERASEISEMYEQGLITDEERYRLTIEAWRDINDKLQEVVKNNFAKEDNSTTITVVSGARAKLSAVSQIIGMLGLIIDVYGNTIELPVKSNYKEGLNALEYFSAARGSRKGLVDTALKTADSGYLTRRLVDVSQDVFTIEENCGEKEGITIERGETENLGIDFAYRLIGRISAETIKGIIKAGELITRIKAEEIATHTDSLRVRSVLKCNAIRGVCQMCYGVDLASGSMVNPMVPVGVIAAQAVGEPGTQLTLDTFHRGGVAGDDITQGLPRVDELFEARNPKGQALIAEVSGKVSVAEENNNYILRIGDPDMQSETHELNGLTSVVKSGQKVTKGDVIAASKDKKQSIVAKLEGEAKVTKKIITIIAKNPDAREYVIPRYRNLLVENGHMVSAGQRITAGSINLQDLLRLTNLYNVQRYLMTEVQRVFSLQGATIADKHLEVIVRQMASRVQIEDPGDSLFVTGDIIGKATVVEENQRLKEEGKQLITYTQLLLGITKSSLATDSWLSAASFQDTTRILIGAATSGRVDRLYGLKENVIIGRKIPVGTGFHGIEVETEVDET